MDWVAGLLLVVGCAALAYLVCYVAFAFISWLFPRESASPSSTSSVETHPVDKEHKIIFDMLRAGKVSDAEAAALLDAIPRDKPSASSAAFAGLRPLLLGMAICVIGFFLPWGYVFVAGDVSLRENGMEAQWFGWLGLSFAVVPVLVMCIPVFNERIESAMLRLLLTGGGFALITGLWGAQCAHNVHVGGGLIAMSIGFALEIAGAAVGFAALRKARAAN